MRQADIARLLPEIFQRTLGPEDAGGDPLRAFLSVMELLHAPSEQILVDLDAFFDPYRAPDRFLPYLAGWVDLLQVWTDEQDDRAPVDVPAFPTGSGRLRELIAAAAELSRWRGTEAGLRRFLETATGLTGFAIEEEVPGADGRAIPFHIRVRVPAEGRPNLRLIRRIIEIEKPAYVTFELEVAD